MPVKGQAVSPCRTYALLVTDSRKKAGQRSSATGGVRLADVSTVGGPRTEYWSYKAVRTTEMPKFFGHALRRKEYVTT